MSLIKKNPFIQENSIKKNSKSLKLYNLNYTVYGQYSNITEVAKYLNCNNKTITRVLKTEKSYLKYV